MTTVSGQKFASKCAASLTKNSCSKRLLSSHATAKPVKKEGDISSVFVSLSGAGPSKLDGRFAATKRDLARGNETQISESWHRLLKKLVAENDIVARKGPNIIPQIEFSSLSKPDPNAVAEVEKRGVAVIRGVIPEEEARNYKTEVEEYIKANPWTKAFPSHDPQVFELYWSPSQVRARSNPNILAAQRFLMNLWHSKDKDAPLSITQPLTYADRLRIRQPGDAGFALGPHVDGGSVERWETTGYGLGGVYEKIWQGKWEEYDPWESSCRVAAVSDLYAGAGACSMFRMFQGWLSMSHTKPNEGTLMVNPMLQLSTAYLLLRPFFSPKEKPSALLAGEYSAEFLDPENWVMQSEAAMTSDLQGANPGHAQELNQILHPHLDLKRTMVHVPEIKPGDFVVWHCDTIHAVDKVHMGPSDSSVMYIPVCPVTESNADYVARQRDSFLHGTPGPDFPGGRGESEHFGRPTEAYLRRHSGREGLQAMGMERLSTMDWAELPGARKVLHKANQILGFS